MGMNEITIRLTRDSLTRPWGFRLQGGSPLQVQRVFSGSPAEGLLKKDDVLLAIDNHDVSRLHHHEVSDLIRVSSGSLLVRLRRNDSANAFSNPTAGEVQVTRSAAPKQYSQAPPPPPMRLDSEAHQDTDYVLRNIENDPDYDFSKKSVQERRQLFSQPESNSYTLPMVVRRGRPSFHRFARKDQHNPALGVPREFGWAPSQDKMLKAKSSAQSTSSAGYLQKSYIPSLDPNVSFDDSVVSSARMQVYSNDRNGPRARCFSSSNPLTAGSNTSEPGTSFLPISNLQKTNKTYKNEIVRQAYPVVSNQPISSQQPKHRQSWGPQPSQQEPVVIRGNNPNVFRVVTVGNSNNSHQTVHKSVPLAHSLPRNFQSTKMHVIRDPKSSGITYNAKAPAPRPVSSWSSNAPGQPESMGNHEFGISDF